MPSQISLPSPRSSIRLGLWVVGPGVSRFRWISTMSSRCSSRESPGHTRPLLHGLGAPDPLVDRLPVFEELSPNAKTRQSRWAEKVHRPLDDAELQAIRRSATTGLPYGDEAWVRRFAKKLDLDLT